MAKKAQFQTADGRIAEFEVPDDATPEQAQAMAREAAPELFGEPPAPLSGEQILGEFKSMADKNASDAEMRKRAADYYPGDDAGSVKIRADLDRALEIRRQTGKMPAMVAGPALGGTAEDDRPESFGQGFIEGIEKPLNNAATWLENGMNSFKWTDKAHDLWGVPTGEGLADTLGRKGNELVGMAPNVAAAEQYQQRGRATSPYSSNPVGKFTGEVTGAGLLSRLPGGALSKGAQAGALLTDNPNDPLAVASGAVTGAVLGKVGQKVINGAAKVAAPYVSPTLRTLIDAGTKVTPGQAARGMDTPGGSLIPKWVAEAEDAGTSKPFLRTRIIAGRENSAQTFMSSTINRAVAPIGETLPDTFNLGAVGGRREAVKWAGDKLGNAFDEVSPNIRLAPDPQFAADLSAISDSNASMPDTQLKQFDRILENLGKFWTDNGQNLSGDAFKEVDARLASEISDYATSLDPDHRKLSRALESVRDAAYDALSRQNPEVARTIQAINKGWKSLTQVERASANSKGMVNPNGYSQAVRLSSDTVRRRGYARGGALNQDLADAGSDILPSELPDSGTGFRTSGWLDGLTGYAQSQAYRGAEAITPLLTRNRALSPGLSSLLRLGAASSPYVAPQLGQPVRDYLPTP